MLNRLKQSEPNPACFLKNGNLRQAPQTSSGEFYYGLIQHISDGTCRITQTAEAKPA